MRCLGSLKTEVSRFYFLIWLRWAFLLTSMSIFLAVILAAFITLFIYIKQGAVPLESAVYEALFKIFSFWFALSWSMTLLLSLFLSLKYLFNRCYASYKLVLLTCPNKEGRSELIELIGYGDLVKVWRKWFMLLIWLVVAQMVIAFVGMKLFSNAATLFSWFNIYVLYLLVLIGGYFSFMVLSAKCKKIKVVKC